MITCEKLKVQNMLHQHILSKKISDASFYEIIRQLEYKSRYNGNRDKGYKDLTKRKYHCKLC